jgi:hypothetical protein
MIPFAKTNEERTANNDPRPSLQERYGDHAGYVAASDEGRGQCARPGIFA